MQSGSPRKAALSLFQPATPRWVRSHDGVRSHYTTLNEPRVEEPRFTMETQRKSPSIGFDSLLLREQELMAKLHEILRSPLASGAARLIDELHQVLSRSRNLS